MLCGIYSILNEKEKNVGCLVIGDL